MRSSASAALIYQALQKIRPGAMSFNEWARQAGVSTSFFTNLKNGSDPSVNNLRQVLAVIGCKLSQFFAAIEDDTGQETPRPCWSCNKPTMNRGK